MATDTNATMRKFGHPATVVADYPHWVLQLRPQQATLGALVLISRAPVTAFGALPPAAFANLAHIVPAVEAALRAAFAYDRVNYLMLMMVDPDVHFHVLPRYQVARSFDNQEFTDPGWPGPPRLDHVNATDAAMNAALVAHIRRHLA
jgi:diadenosine tetraphosphate (Ap4A) HIT family hydrolase